MEMFLLAIAILVITILFFKGIRIFNYIDHVAGIMEMIPGPTPYPFVGNIFQFGLKPDGELIQGVEKINLNCMHNSKTKHW